MSELLLIDDDTELCDLLSRWLSQEGFQVSACHDAHSARALLTQTSPDAVILDVMLPDGSGLCAIEMARARHGHLPALVITGDTAAAHLQTLLNVGVPVLHKPFQTDGLLRVIQLQFSVGETAVTSPRYSSA